MKTIGLLGGMSWESTVSYYQSINQLVKQSLGGLHSAKIAMRSVDFQQIETLQHKGDWQQLATILANEAKLIEAGGADGLLICTNTMHKVAEQVSEAINIPLLHIADATAEKLITDGVKTVGLLGTKFTMEQDFYKGRLTDNYGLNVLVPDEKAQDIVHQVIYQELCLGQVKDESRQQYVEIISKLQQQGAQAVILGCTEIALLVSENDTTVPLYNTTEIHAQQAVEWALSDTD